MSRQQTFALAATIATVQALSVTGRGTVQYDHAEPDGYSASNSGCSEAELSWIDGALASALPAIEFSNSNDNAELFDKWFGLSTSSSDADVKSRMNDATYMMRRRGQDWTPMCCKSGNGACGPSC